VTLDTLITHLLLREQQLAVNKSGCKPAEHVLALAAGKQHSPENAGHLQLNDRGCHGSHDAQDTHRSLFKQRPKEIENWLTHDTSPRQRRDPIQLPYHTSLYDRRTDFHREVPGQNSVSQCGNFTGHNSGMDSLTVNDLTRFGVPSNSAHLEKQFGPARSATKDQRQPNSSLGYPTSAVFAAPCTARSVVPP
jgi:hypothetical protein